MGLMRCGSCAFVLVLSACAQGGFDEEDAGRGDGGRSIDATIDPIDAGRFDAGSGCTPENAAEVCGAMPCVDGVCCDGPCDGACVSCALAGSEGACTPIAAGADPDEECATMDPSSCGTSGACDGAGACEMHTALCDDGDLCTHTDRCTGGVCAGTTVVCENDECAIRACNGTETCSMSPNPGAICDDENPCTYNDRCDGAGACTAEGTTVCNDTPCLDRSCNGTAACVETIRTGAACDDGNPCTYADACSATGMCSAGTPISCDAMDNTCRDFSCNGTAVCTSVARNAGMACDDGNAMTLNDQCRADGTCSGFMGCVMPIDACANGAQSRDRCTGARIIGRMDAADADAFRLTGTTCSASNRFDDCSWDAGRDHAYRIWLRNTEQIAITVSTTSGSCGPDWAATIKIFESTGCGDVTCTRDVWCEDHVGSSAYTYTANHDGWVVIVVDGSTAFDDWGSYTLTVDLTTCVNAGCEC
jgi:hypothetical protein